MMTLPLIDRRYHLATTVSDALLAKREMGPEAVYLGGGTALQLGWSDGQVPPPLIDVAALRRPSPAELDQDHLHLCAFAPLEAFRADMLVKREFDALSMALETIASFEVRRLGTLGGNVTWTKGDLRPLMLAVGAEAMTSDGVISFARWIEHREADTLLLSIRISTRIKRRCFRESWLSRGLFTELCYVELLRSRWSRLRCDRRRREPRGTIAACGRRVVVAAAADGGRAKRNDQRRGSSSGRCCLFRRDTRGDGRTHLA